MEKIIAQHALDLDHPHVTAGQTVLVRVDWCMASELTWKSMDAIFSRLGRPALPAPERFWLAIDHTVDPRINKTHTKPRALIKLASDFAREAGLTDTFRPPNEEIMHTEFVRQEAAPGQLIVGADSHTCSADAEAFCSDQAGAIAGRHLCVGYNWTLAVSHYLLVQSPVESLAIANEVWIPHEADYLVHGARTKREGSVDTGLIRSVTLCATGRGEVGRFKRFKVHPQLHSPRILGICTVHLNSGTCVEFMR